MIACIGSSRDGRLFNVNADTLAASLAARLGARRLVIAGGTAGALDHQGKTIPTLDTTDIDRLVKSGTATAGMIAKLNATRKAMAGGVDVAIADGRRPARLNALVTGSAGNKGPWTRLQAATNGR